MELEERKRKLLEDIIKYFPEEKQQVENILKASDENMLLQYIIKKEKQINDYKKNFINRGYADVDGSTYYADIEEDKTIYDPTVAEDKKEIDSALEQATKDYLDIDPRSVHDEKDYRNFIRGEIVYDNQIGYRAIESEKGLFHIIQRESSYFIYPSKNINLNIPTHVEICNAIFKNKENMEFQLGDEIELDGVTPAEIFSPFIAVIDDPINKLNMSDILINQGVILDNSFKNTKFKDINLAGLKNIVTKGTIKCKRKAKEEIKYPEEVSYQEELIVGPTKYIDGTFIPQPREQKSDESYGTYTEYLKKHYERYGYKVEYDKDNNPIYPHKLEKSKTDDVKDEEILLEETNEQKYNFNLFMASKGIKDYKKLEKSILLSYLKAYRGYLIAMKENKTINEEYYNTQINDTLRAIEAIEESRILL